jgi:hypothetical protein
MNLNLSASVGFIALFGVAMFEWISPGQLDESGLRDRTNDL